MLLMTEGDICKAYREAKHKKMQVMILADLNLTDEKEIRKILKKHGELGKQEKEGVEKKKRRKGTVIVQMDEEGNEVAVWETAKQAAMATNTNAGTISMCCNGKRETAKGYKWKRKKICESV